MRTMQVAIRTKVRVWPAHGSTTQEKTAVERTKTKHWSRGQHSRSNSRVKSFRVFPRDSLMFAFFHRLDSKQFSSTRVALFPVFKLSTGSARVLFLTQLKAAETAKPTAVALQLLQLKAVCFFLTETCRSFCSRFSAIVRFRTFFDRKDVIFLVFEKKSRSMTAKETQVDKNPPWFAECLL